MIIDMLCCPHCGIFRASTAGPCDCESVAVRPPLTDETAQRLIEKIRAA